METVLPASAVPVRRREVSLEESPDEMVPVRGEMSSVTEVMTGADGAVASRIDVSFAVALEAEAVTVRVPSAKDETLTPLTLNPPVASTVALVETLVVPSLTVMLTVVPCAIFADVPLMPMPAAASVAFRLPSPPSSMAAVIVGWLARAAVTVVSSIVLTDVSTPSPIGVRMTLPASMARMIVPAVVGVT